MSASLPAPSSSVPHPFPSPARPRGAVAPWRAPLLLAVAFGAVTSAAALAETAAQSQAYGVAAEVQGLAAAEVKVSPTPVAAGEAPPAYDRQEEVASATIETTLGTFVRTGVVEVAARSEAPGTAATTAAATVHDLDALQGGLVRLVAAEVRSSAEIRGACDSGLAAAGGTELVGAHLLVGGILPTQLTLTGSPGPNTVVFDQLGVRVVLNEHGVSGNGTGAAAVSVNAIHVYLSDFLVAGQLVSGDLVIGHTEAAVECATSAAQADLGVTVTADRAEALPGEELRYDIRVTNGGPDGAPGVMVTDRLPAEVTLLGTSPSQGSCTGSSSVTCALGTVAAGGAASIGVRVRVAEDAAGTLSNQVEVSASIPDPDPFNNAFVLVTPVKRGEGGEDADDDGVPDALDNCPVTPNGGQQDTDGDGAGDACDECPDAPGPCEDGDQDGDGVPDGRDNCPASPNLDQQDADGDGIGDACEAFCPQGAQAPAGDALLLAGGRFRVELTWKTPAGLAGRGRVRSLSENGGYFWFFHPEDVEVIVRVHDACAAFAHFWVFTSGLTNLEVQLTVTDLATGRRRTYANPQGQPFEPVLDTRAFRCGA
jgi:uncharacterized repeat protein (TIGR01451 family)